MLDISDSDDPEGLKSLYYLVQDLRCLVFSLIAVHFKVCIIKHAHFSLRCWYVACPRRSNQSPTEIGWQFSRAVSSTVPHATRSCRLPERMLLS